MRRIERYILISAGVGALATLLPYAFPVFRIRYMSSELRVGLETTQALIALLVTHLSYGRFRRSGLVSDLLLAYGMGLFAVANLLILVGPLSGASADVVVLQTWASLIIRVIGTSAIVWAAWDPTRGHRTSAAAVQLMGAHAVTVAGVLVALISFSDAFPAAVTVSVDDMGATRLEGHPIALGAQLASMILYWTAAAGFARAAQKRQEALTIALAMGFVLAGFSRLNFFLYPSLYTNIVQTGDFLRLAWYLTLLVGAEREIHSYWAKLTEAAVADERRRTARELHDGLVQELSFIHSQAATLAENGSPVLRRVTFAAERALQESRLAINTLSGDRPEDLATLLLKAGKEIVERAGAKIRVDASGVELSPHISVALSRIVREACSNAVRHGRAQNVFISVERRGRNTVRLTVRDDGKGFDVEAAARGGGFGLAGMSERARDLGGGFQATSSSGQGATIEITLPAK